MGLIDIVINFWLFVSGGAIWTEFAVAMTFIGTGTLLIALSLYMFMLCRERSWLPHIFALLVFISGFTGTLYFSLSASDEVRSYFNDCVQLETKTERFEQTVMVAMCRQRVNIKDLWGPWNVVGLQRSRHRDMPVVTELP